MTAMAPQSTKAPTRVRLDAPVAAIVELNEAQLRHRDGIQSALDNGVLRMEKSVCFCGEERGLTLLGRDAWGFQIPTVMCRRCYTLRSAYSLDDDSMTRFYAEGYYRAHMFTSRTSDTGIGMSEADYRREEEQKGEDLHSWLAKNVDIHHMRSVLDVGCGVGGVLRAFQDRGLKIFGCDYVPHYIEAARREMPGGDFRIGSLEQFKAGENFDLVILADVVEHLREPLAFLRDLRRLLHENSLVLTVMPGLFGISNQRFGCSFRLFTKIEHTWCHTLQSLNNLMRSAGYQLRAGNQGIMAVYRAGEAGRLPALHPRIGYAAFTLLFLGSLPLRRALKLDRHLYAAARRLLRRSDGPPAGGSR
jgi:SAM-dependent methyltransferase